MPAMDNHSFDSPTELVKRQGLNVLGLNITVSCLHLYEVFGRRTQLTLLSERDFGLYCSHLMRLQRHFENYPPYLTN